MKNKIYLWIIVTEKNNYLYVTIFWSVFYLKILRVSNG